VDRETITTLIMFGAVVGLVMSGYYMRKVMEEIERKENITRMSREWVMRNHPTNNKGEWK
jgi:hypothetical protein